MTRFCFLRYLLFSCCFLYKNELWKESFQIEESVNPQSMPHSWLASLSSLKVPLLIPLNSHSLVTSSPQLNSILLLPVSFAPMPDENIIKYCYKYVFISLSNLKGKKKWVIYAIYANIFLLPKLEALLWIWCGRIKDRRVGRLEEEMEMIKLLHNLHQPPSCHFSKHPSKNCTYFLYE